MKTHPYLSMVSLKPSAAAHAQEFPFPLPVVRSLDRLVLHPNITFLVGENGSGRRTRRPADHRFLRRQVAARTVARRSLGERGIHRIGYEETEHYRVMHDFIANPERMLKVLMER